MTTTNKNFEVKERNTYSLGTLVNSAATTSIAQFIQLQTLCYYFDIAIVCTQSRALTCDLLTELNNAANAGQLPVRTNKKGRAYLNKSGIMVFSDTNFKAYPYHTLIGTTSDLSLPQMKHVNNALLKNYKEKGLSAAERASRLIPSDVTVESITKTMMVIVKLYKITFDLNRDLTELYEAQNKCALAIKSKTLTLRKISGEAYIENQVIRFKAAPPVEENKEIAKEISEAENNVKETEGVAQAASFFVTCKATEDKTARIIYIGNTSELMTITCAYRTGIKSCAFLGVQELVKNGCKNATIFVDKKAEGFIREVDEFSSENDKCVQELARTNNLNVQVFDAKEEAYQAFLATCI